MKKTSLLNSLLAGKDVFFFIVSVLFEFVSAELDDKRRKTDIINGYQKKTPIVRGSVPID